MVYNRNRHARLVDKGVKINIVILNTLKKIKEDSWKYEEKQEVIKDISLLVMSD